jgi:hypothetical protein
MYPILLLLLPRSALLATPTALAVVDVSGQRFTERQRLSEAVMFSDCAFVECHTTIHHVSDNRGGAIYLSDRFLSLDLTRCTFEKCWADDAGALYVDSCLRFSMIETSGIRCSTRGEFSFCFVCLSSTALGSLNVRGLSVASGTSHIGTLYFTCLSASSGAGTLLGSVNSSWNTAEGGKGGAPATTSICLSTSARSSGTRGRVASISTDAFWRATFCA